MADAASFHLDSAAARSDEAEDANTNNKEICEDRVLVTGASGYLGTHVVKVLLDAGYKVRGTVRNVKDEKKVKHLYNLCPNAAHPLELVEADLTDKSCWKKAVSGCTYVMHTASPFPLVNPQTADELVVPAVNGTLSVLEACRDAGGVKRVVLTSSIIAICGSGGNSTPYTENDWSDESKTNFYGQSKIKAEKAAWEFIRNLPDEAKFELSVVNPAFIAGPTLHGTPGSSMIPVQRLLLRQMPAVPRFSLAVCDVRDVALAHLRCMKTPEANGERHIVYSGSIWLHELAKVLDQEFRQHGYNVPTSILPNFLVSIYSLFDKEVASTKKAASAEMKLDNARMKNVLNITPTPINKTYVDMAYSMIDQGFVKKTDKYTPRTEKN